MKAGKLTILIVIGLMFILLGVVSAMAYYPSNYNNRYYRPNNYGRNYYYNNYYNNYYRAPYYQHYTPYYMMQGWWSRPYYYANHYYRGYRGYPTFSHTYYRPGGWYDPYGGWR